MSQSKEQKRKAPTAWHAVGIGIVTGILGLTIGRLIFAPKPISVAGLFADIFSLTMLIICLPSIGGAYVALKKKTFKALWVGAILGFVILIGIVVFGFLLIFGSVAQ